MPSKGPEHRRDVDEAEETRAWNPVVVADGPLAPGDGRGTRSPEVPADVTARINTETHFAASKIPLRPEQIPADEMKRRAVKAGLFDPISPKKGLIPIHPSALTGINGAEIGEQIREHLRSHLCIRATMTDVEEWIDRVVMKLLESDLPPRYTFRDQDGPWVFKGRRVGQGGCGEAFEGYHEGFPKQKLLVKSMLPCADGDPQRDEFYTRTVQEAKTLQRLLAEHISDVPKLYGAGDDHGDPYLIEEFINGPTLQDIFRAAREREETLSVRYLMIVARYLAKTLSAVHAKNFVHRDIKPANIMLCPIRKRPVIIDWGLSKELGANQTELTRSNVGIGTMEYMPPEQRIDAKHVDSRADVYALGRLLLEGATSRMYSSKKSLGGVEALLAVHSDLQRGIDAVKKIHPAFGSLLDAMLADIPTDRPSTVFVHQEISKMLEGEKNIDFELGSIGDPDATSGREKDEQDRRTSLAENIVAQVKSDVPLVVPPSAPLWKNRRVWGIGAVSGTALLSLAALFQAAGKGEQRDAAHDALEAGAAGAEASRESGSPVDVVFDGDGRLERLVFSPGHPDFRVEVDPGNCLHFSFGPDHDGYSFSLNPEQLTQFLRLGGPLHLPKGYEGGTYGKVFRNTRRGRVAVNIGGYLAFFSLDPDGTRLFSDTVWFRNRMSGLCVETAKFKDYFAHPQARELFGDFPLEGIQLGPIPENYPLNERSEDPKGVSVAITGTVKLFKDKVLEASAASARVPGSPEKESPDPFSLALDGEGKLQRLLFNPGTQFALEIAPEQCVHFSAGRRHNVSVFAMNKSDLINLLRLETERNLPQGMQSWCYGFCITEVDEKKSAHSIIFIGSVGVFSIEPDGKRFFAFNANRQSYRNMFRGECIETFSSIGDYYGHPLARAVFEDMSDAVELRGEIPSRAIMNEQLVTEEAWVRNVVAQLRGIKNNVLAASEKK